MTDERSYRIAPEKLVVVGLDTRDGEEHPLWDERIALPIDDAMVLSIMAIGVRVPVEVLVRADRFVVVDGRQRTRNAREANKRLAALHEVPLTVPIIATQGSRLSEEMASLIATTLNELRSGDPFPVRARRAKRLLDRGLEHVQVATAFGIVPSTLDDWMQVLHAHPVILSSIESGEISLKVAIELTHAPLAAQPQALEALIHAPVRPNALRARTLADGKTPPSRGWRGSVSDVLAQEALFDAEFIRGVRFAKGTLPSEEVAEILSRLESVV